MNMHCCLCTFTVVILWLLHHGPPHQVNPVMIWTKVLDHPPNIASPTATPLSQLFEYLHKVHKAQRFQLIILNETLLLTWITSLCAPVFLIQRLPSSPMMAACIWRWWCQPSCTLRLRTSLCVFAPSGLMASSWPPPPETQPTHSGWSWTGVVSNSRST